MEVQRAGAGQVAADKAGFPDTWMTLRNLHNLSKLRQPAQGCRLFRINSSFRF
jgi:hypothetical protein